MIEWSAQVTLGSIVAAVSIVTAVIGAVLRIGQHLSQLQVQLEQRFTWLEVRMEILWREWRELGKTGTDGNCD